MSARTTFASVLVVGGTVSAALGVALAPTASYAAASDVVHYSYSDPATTFEFPCGATWTTAGEHRGTYVQRPDGSYKVVQHDYYPGTITYQGRTYRADDHQADITTVLPDGTQIGHLNGQGLFTHLPGTGVVVHDNGHLVFVETTGQTIKASAKVIPLDQDFDYGAAVCDALTSATAH